MNLDRSTDSGRKGPAMDKFVSTDMSAIESILTAEKVDELSSIIFQS